MRVSRADWPTRSFWLPEPGRRPATRWSPQPALRGRPHPRARHHLERLGSEAIAEWVLRILQGFVLQREDPAGEADQYGTGCLINALDAIADFRANMLRRIVTRSADALRGKTARSLTQIYAVQMAGYALPLVTVPYLARRLGVSGVGLVATFTALANYLSILNEFGFSLSATREAARLRDDQTRLSRRLGSVIGAKLLLAGLSTALAVLASELIKPLGHHHVMLASALLYSFGQSASLLWFYQGLDRIAFAATWDLCGRLVGVILIFVFVRGPQDGWLALAVPGW